MRKLKELLRLKFEAKLTHRQIGKALNISPGTVSYYSQAAEQAGLSWPISESLSQADLVNLIEPKAKQLRNKHVKKIIPDCLSINKAMSQKHMTLQLLWEDYLNENPKNYYSYTQFTRHYKDWCKKQQVTMRLEHTPGEKGFIDYAGTTIPVYNRQTNLLDFEAQLFLMVLGFSHYTFACASRSQTLPDWIDAHQQAMKFFGGVPQVWVPDNLKSGITDSCQFEPEANPTYAELAQHYQAAIIPARPRTPRDKGVVENAVLIVSRWIIARLQKQKFYSLNSLNNAITELLTALNKKAFQKRQGSRYQQFIDVEKNNLLPLPKESYEFAKLRYQTIPKDYHVYLEHHYYSVPYTFVREKVLCRYTKHTVEIFQDTQRIASHMRSYEKDSKTTLKSHMPANHKAYQDWTPQIFLDWARNTGAGVLNVAKIIINNKPHSGHCSKFHFGLKKLCKRFGAKRLEKACRRAIVLECVHFKSIQSILENGLDQTPHIQLVQAPDTPHDHDNIRGIEYYQEETLC